MVSESLLSKLDVDDSIFNRENFINDLGKRASRDELQEFIEKLRRNCTTLKTERISFINDKYPEVIDAIQVLTQVEERFIATKGDLERISAIVGGISDEFDGMNGCQDAQNSQLLNTN